MFANETYKILIVDDEDYLHQRAKTKFVEEFKSPFVFVGARSQKELFDCLEKHRIEETTSSIDLVLLDLVLDRNSEDRIGLALLDEIKQMFPALPVIIVTKDKKTDTVVTAMRKGALDYFCKLDRDFEIWNEKMLGAIRVSKEVEEKKKKIEELEDKVSLLSAGRKEHSFIGESDKIKEVKAMLKYVAQKPHITVLLNGETGVGKEVAARYIHSVSPRKDKPFVAVNLSAIQESMLESELFGHVKGAYTGAIRDKEGYFRQAQGGILLLDEIGDINAAIQIKLLRLLETQLIRPVGSDKDIQLDVQIITATHKNLILEVQAEKFRSDLYQRLKNMLIVIPPLRERKEDITIILNYFLEKQGLSQDLIQEAVREKLIEYAWRGNVRELATTVEYMLSQRAILEKDIIDLDCLPYDILHYRPIETLVAPIIKPHNEVITASDINIETLSYKERSAYLSLHDIEQALILKNGVKQDVVSTVGFKSSDALLYFIKTRYKSYPSLYNAFPNIKRHYKKHLK